MLESGFFSRRLHDNMKRLANSRLGISMKLPGSELVGIYATMRMFHSVSGQATDALLLCNSSQLAAHISTAVIQLAPISTHPAALPAILCSTYQSVLQQRISRTWDDLFAVEQNGGQSGIHLMTAKGELLPFGNGDDPSLSRKAIRTTQLATAWSIYSSRGNILTTAVKTFVKSYSGNSIARGGEALTEQNRILLEYLDTLSQRQDDLHYMTRHLLERSRLQVEAVSDATPGGQ